MKKASAEAKTKPPNSRVKTKAKRVLRGKGSLRAVLAEKVTSGGKLSPAESKMLASIPPEKRPGFRTVAKRKKGVKYTDPRKWKTIENIPVDVDFGRRAWLPNDWTQGLKRTKSGGTYTVFLPPTEERTLYHPGQIEKYLGRKITPPDCFQGQLRVAAFARGAAPLNDREFLQKMLSRKEKKHLVDKKQFHFAIVSARRAQSFEGARDIAMVQQAFLDAGVTPTWYVDAASLDAYRALGLVAVVGGKLTPARNMALRDAEHKRKVCVQCSDDLTTWEYRYGPQAIGRTMDEQNSLHRIATVFRISPVAAARFILAKMRSAPEDQKPRLGGAYVLGCCSRTWGGDEFSRRHFILGDFFVADQSKVRFDERLTLKEDYDFVCSHIKAHGSVFRCNRMTFNAKHYSNAGGAVSIRDSKQEKENIKILTQKWAGIITPNARRKNEVLLRWPKGKSSKEKMSNALEKSKKKKKKNTREPTRKAKKSTGQKATGPKRKTMKKKAKTMKAKSVLPRPGTPGKAGRLAAALSAASAATTAAGAVADAVVGAVAGAMMKLRAAERRARRKAAPTKPKPKPTSKSSPPPPPPPLPERAVRLLAKAKLTPTDRLVATSKEAKAPYIRRRVCLLAGRTVGSALAMRCATSTGERCAYKVTDLKYDLASGFLVTG